MGQLFTPVPRRITATADDVGIAGRLVEWMAHEVTVTHLTPSKLTVSCRTPATSPAMGQPLSAQAILQTPTLRSAFFVGDVPTQTRLYSTPAPRQKRQHFQHVRNDRDSLSCILLFHSKRQRGLNLLAEAKGYYPRWTGSERRPAARGQSNGPKLTLCRWRNGRDLSPIKWSVRRISRCGSDQEEVCAQLVWAGYRTTVYLGRYSSRVVKVLVRDQGQDVPNWRSWTIPPRWYGQMQ